MANHIESGGRLNDSICSRNVTDSWAATVSFCVRFFFVDPQIFTRLLFEIQSLGGFLQRGRGDWI